MGKIILQMMITIDGFVAGPNDELDWIDNDPVMGIAHYDLAKNADAAIMGHTVYGGMAGFWPQVATNPSSPRNEAAFAKLMNGMSKIVISTKKEELEWTNASQCLVKDEADLARKVEELKAKASGYLLLYGGVQTAQTFITHGLVDEYRFDVCPIALGKGKPIFTTRTNLEFVSATPYESGAMTATYRSKK